MKISVVISSRDQAAALSATLESIYTQDYQDIEVLVSDSGSSDGSQEILQRWSARTRGAALRWLSEEQDDQVNEFNRGLRASAGEVLACLRPGDVYCPGTLSTVADHFRSHPDCLALYGRARRLHGDGSVKEDYPTEPWDYARLLETEYLCLPAVFWRREVMARFGVFDDALEYGWDHEYWLRVGQDAPFDYLGVPPLAGARGREETLTPDQQASAFLELARVVQKYSPRSEPVLGQIKQAARCKSRQMGSPDAADSAGRQRFAAALAAHSLLGANALAVTPTDDFLEAMEDDLTRVGL